MNAIHKDHNISELDWLSNKWVWLHQLTDICNEEFVVNNDSDYCGCSPSNLIVQSVQIWTLIVSFICTQALKYASIMMMSVSSIHLYITTTLNFQTNTRSIQV